MQKKEKKCSLLAVVLTVLIVSAVVTTSSFAWIKANYLGSAYEGTQEGKSSAAAIEALVTEGAGFFLKSYSGYLLFLNRIELWDGQGGDFGDLQGILELAVTDLEDAARAYESLVGLIEVTPYNQRLIDFLKFFDYHDFMTKNSLNGIIFQEVEKELRKGDVTAIGRRIRVNCTAVLDLLHSLKRKYVDAEIFPPLRLLWNLQQNYSHALLFGQYTTQILYEIKEKN